MVLCSQNSGRYLSRTWAHDRADAMEHPENYTSEQLARLEIPAGVAPNGLFDAVTTPLDPKSTPHSYDIRDPRYRPEVGA